MASSVARSRLLTVFAIFGAGAIASVAAGWRAPQVAELSPSDVVALRFADSWNEVSDSSAAADPAERNASDESRLVLFSPSPLYPPANRQAVLFEQPAQGQTDDRAFAGSQVAAMVESTADMTSRHARPHSQLQVRAKPAPRAPQRPVTVLNDAQIASIKKRLNLSPDQEHMWPSVEAALRKLVYAKAPGAPRSQPSHVIDPNSSELQHLKSAAVPLVMSFNSDQKRELRTLVQVMGLEKLASQI